MSSKQRSENLTLVAQDIAAKLEDPFARSSTFGRLRWLTDNTLLAAVITLLLCATLALLLLIGGRIGTGKSVDNRVTLSIENVTLGDGLSSAMDVAEASGPEIQTEQSAVDEVASEPLADVELKRGRELSSADIKVADSASSVSQLSTVTLPKSMVSQGRAGGGSPGSASISGIFNVDPNVKSVVFVIDRSGSMAGSRINRVKAELIHAINRLDESQRFSVVFFESLAWPVFSQRGVAAVGYGRPIEMVPAVGADKTKAVDWIQTMPASGGTNPLPAMMMAMDVEPQQITLLSDGEFSDIYVDRIQQRNAGRSVIRCIGFGEVNRTLQRIAKENGGSYITAM